MIVFFFFLQSVSYVLAILVYFSVFFLMMLVRSFNFIFFPSSFGKILLHLTNVPIMRCFAVF